MIVHLHYETIVKKRYLSIETEIPRIIADLANEETQLAVVLVCRLAANILAIVRWSSLLASLAFDRRRRSIHELAMPVRGGSLVEFKALKGGLLSADGCPS